MHCTFAYSMFVLLLSARMHAMHICSCWQTPDFCLLFVVNKLAKKYATKTGSLWQQSVFVLRPFLTTTLVMSWWPVNLTSWICGTSQKSLDAPAVWGSRTRQHRSAEKNSIVQNNILLIAMLKVWDYLTRRNFIFKCKQHTIYDPRGPDNVT